MPSRYKPVEYIEGAIAPSARVEGLSETIAMLDALPREVCIGGLNKALHAAAMVFEAELEARTPIRLAVEAGDLVVEGGELKTAVMHEVTLDSNYRGGIAEVGFGRLGFIANFIEYGHRMVTHRPDREEVGFVPAYPFMRPSFEAGADRAIQAFTRSMAETVESANRKAVA